MRTLIIVFVLAGLAAGAGYYFGLDQGFEKATEETKTVTSNTGEQPAGSTEGAKKASDPIVGLWRSADDTKFTREFQEGGVAIDRYEGRADATTEGVWHRFQDPTDEPAPFTIQPGVKYLKIALTEEVLYFSIAKLTDTELELVYLGVGETLRFTRVK